jgi:plastocyanin
MTPTRPLQAVLLISSLFACANSGENLSKQGRVEDSSAGTVALGLGRANYQPTGVSAGSELTGTISLQGDARDSVVATSRDSSTCGDSASVTEIRPNGTSLPRALVWIDGMQSGKPLPEIRRETVTIERCRFEPRVVAVTKGSTINVFSRDRAAHDARFYREGAGEPVARVQTVDAGQVVPSEAIAAEAGVVEVRCALHPWTRGYIAVFEHPYFTISDANGAFKIDGLPAGSYTIKVWHEGLEKPYEQRVAVGAGGTGRLDVALALK